MLTLQVSNRVSKGGSLMPRINKRFVDSLKPLLDKEFVKWDDQMPGFGIRVKPSGVKSYLIQYRNQAGRSRRLTIGRHGQISPAVARDIAGDRFADIKKGLDPAGEKTTARAGMTLNELADSYMTKHLIPKGKPSTVKEWRRLLDTTILPKLGGRKVADLKRSDIERLHRSLKKTPTTANRVLTTLSAMLVFAEREGVRPDFSNPTRNITKYPEKKRERFLTASELSSLGDALSAAESDGETHPSAILAIRLLILTGARKSEILNLTWNEVDLERECLSLSESKTGQKVIHLGPPALELLSNSYREKDNPYVCFGVNPGEPYKGLQAAWKRIRDAANFEDVRIHDLRHSHASVGVGLGLSLPIVGKLLGHSNPATTSRYAHLADDPAKQAAVRVSGEIDAAMNRKSAKVVRLKR